MLKSYSEVKKALSAGRSVVDIVNGYLSEINKQRELNAFLEVFEKDALEQAQIIDDKIKAGSAGILAGMVIGLKDNICFAGHHVSA
ncbi:MAG: hypothetical protein RLZZ569_1237 [Bacteroidota bacterium]